MTSRRKPAPRKTHRRAAGTLALALAGAPLLAQAAPLDVFYERTVMTAADARCGLFTADIATALAVGQAQARGAALRAGADEGQLAAVERRARAAVARTGCGSRDIAVAAGRVREAFEGYSKMTRQTYPGDHAAWRADRERAQSARWRLAQSASFGWDRMVFGMAGRENPGVLLAVAQFADGKAPYTARLVMRDAGRSLGPYLDVRAADAKGQLPLARRLPPSALRSYSAEARSPAGADLLPKDMKSGWAFRFPAQAARDLAQLDPREAVAVEFVFAGREDVVRRAYVEVGDFAAGQAFVRMAQR